MDTAIIVAVLTSSVVVEIIRWIRDTVNDHKREQEKEDVLKEAMRVLLRDRILHLCTKYVDAGEVPHKHYESLYDLYKSYKNLNGNGFIDDEMDRVKELPRI